MLEQIHEGAQLQPRDVGPAPTALDTLQQAEQLAAVGWQAAPEGTVLDGAMQLLELAQQGQQGLRLAFELTCQIV